VSQAGNGTTPNYSSYLKLEELLESQSPLSRPEHPDELHFIVTHQAMELWFKVMIHELGRVIGQLAAEDWALAVFRLRRVNAILRSQTAQMGTLNLLDPEAFRQFRDHLGSASGAQSEQFRAIEVLSGLRDHDYLRRLAGASGVLPVVVEKALEHPSLADMVLDAPSTGGAGSWAEVYRRPEAYGELFLLAEEMVEYDRLWVLWRYEHMLTVERVIGRLTRGTGGASATFLEKRASIRFFPFLWNVRHELYASGTPGADATTGPTAALLRAPSPRG
jgi:tryptophan 2,3-dioxygenase